MVNNTLIFLLLFSLKILWLKQWHLRIKETNIFEVVDTNWQSNVILKQSSIVQNLRKVIYRHFIKTERRPMNNW